MTQRIRFGITSGEIAFSAWLVWTAVCGGLQQARAAESAPVGDRMGKPMQNLGPRTPLAFSLAEAPGAWQDYTAEPILIQKDPENFGLVALMVDHSAEAAQRGGPLVLVWQRRWNKLVVERLGLEGGAPRRIGAEFPGSSRAYRGVQVALGGDAVFVASDVPGFVMVRTEGVEVSGQIPAAPSNEVFHLGWLEGRLYVSVRDGFARFNPEDKSFQLLASGRASASRHPFDGGGSYFIYQVIPDPGQKCLWLDVQDNDLPRSRYGVWRYEPESANFQHVHHKMGHRTIIVPRDDGGTLFCLDGDTPWAEYNVDSAQLARISGYGSAKPPPHRPYVIARFVRLRTHIISAYGQLFTPDGKEHGVPTDETWQFLQRVGSGFVTHYDSQRSVLWYVKPKRAEMAPTHEPPLAGASGPQPAMTPGPVSPRIRPPTPATAKQAETGATRQTPTKKDPGADAKPATRRWAVISGDPKSAALADLLTVEISQWPDVQLVERDAIAQVLDELKLNASGLVAAERTVEFGKLAAAEVVVLVEVLPKLAPPLTRLRAVETRTGIRLLDFLASTQSPNRDTQALIDELARAKARCQVTPAARRYVGVLGVHSEEPGPHLDPTAQALTAFLEHDLRGAPQIHVLERDQLQRLTAERDLTGVELELRASTVFVEVGLLRDADTDGYVLHGKLTSPDGKTLRQETWPSPNRVIADVRRMLVERVEQALDVDVALPATRDLAREAELFARQSRWLASNGRVEDALRAIESAVALCPTREYYRDAYRLYTMRAEPAGLQLQAKPVRADGSLPRQMLEAALWEALTAARRAHEVDRAQMQMEGSDGQTYGTSWDMFQPHVPHWLPDEPPQHAQVRAAMDQIRVAKYQIMCEQRKQRGQGAADLVLHRLAYANYFADSAEQFARSVLELQAQIDAELADLQRRQAEPGAPREFPSGARLSRLRSQNFCRLCDQIRWTCRDRYSSSDDREPKKWPVESLTPLWTSLRQHKDPLVRLSGLYGLALVDGPVGDAAAREMMEHLGDVPDDPYAAIQAGNLCRRAADRLEASGELEGFVEGLVSQAEQAQDARRVMHFPGGFMTLLFPRFRADPRDWRGRLVRLLEAAKLEGEEARQGDAFRQSLALWSSSMKHVNTDVYGEIRLHGAWAEYSYARIAFTKPKEGGQLMGVLVDKDPQAAERDEQLVLFWRVGGLAVARASVKGGASRELARVPYNSDLQPFDKLIVAALSPTAIAVSTGLPGLAVITERGAESFGVQEGFPGRMVYALAWLDGLVYMNLGNGLASFDPGQRKFRLLGSATAVGNRGPLEGKDAYRVAHLLADPDRHCLWLGLSGSPALGGRGLWRYTPQKEEFVEVYRLPESQPMVFLAWDGNQLFFLAGKTWRHFDPATGIIKELVGYQPYRAQGPAILARVGEQIIGSQGLLLTPDGQEHALTLPSRWHIVVPWGQGFLTGTLPNSQGEILRFERHPAP